MKLTLRQSVIAFLSAVIFAVAIWAFVPVAAASADTDVSNITCATASGNYLNDDYLSVYRVPTSMMKFESNGGEQSNHPLSAAFDGSWNTFWQTGTENAGQQNETPTFLNAITVKFSKSVTIESIVYASSSERVGHGYPATLNIYTANGGELSLYGTCKSAPTDDKVVFALKETITVTQIKFEFRVVNTAHNWTATAKEIQFLQPDNSSANDVLDLFEDYAQFSVKDNYKTRLGEIRNNVKSLISYESALKPLLDRADALLDGHLKKDARREFSTDPNAANVINRYGDLRAYASGTLKLTQFGINRQVTGVGGLAGQTITVYVEAASGDPLPSIVFTQAYSNWSGWQSTYRLSLGKNVVTFPNMINSGYTNEVIAGGAIHIVNAYEPSQQSSNVRVYIEGGYLYPVFRKNGDENSFRQELAAYYGIMNVEGLNDIVEIVGDHFIHTATASRAYNDYVSRTVSPQRNAELWDEYLVELLKFDGIAMDPSGEHYNEKNLHLYMNFRKVQPWAGAGAYAAGDHIGFISFGEDAMTNFGVPGWGIAHEIGHSLDVGGRIISETTNNMWSKFALAALENGYSTRHIDLSSVLTPDETAVSSGYFNSNSGSYFWWHLEMYFRGFWGKLDNMYRYFDETAARSEAGVTAEDGNLSQTERMVFYSSMATGVDLGYFYERVGFSFSLGENYAPFTRSGASSAYTKLVGKAIANGALRQERLKLWYLDAREYLYDELPGCYNQSSSVEIVSASKTSAGYTLYLPTPADAAAHLGYEIMEYRNGNWYVIGFTYSRSYTDTTKYANGYVPQYKIRAYDRRLNCSAESAAVRYTDITQSNVCRIGTKYYNTLSEAVAAASANDTIYICANLYDGAITVDKNLTILPDPSLTGSVVIAKSAGGVLFTVNNGVTLTIGDNDGAKIVLDGNSFSQNGALIRVNGGILHVNNAELRNNYNTDHGGAVYNAGNSTFTNVTMTNNTTSINGGAIANFSGGVIALTDCIISGNSASANGGALALDGKTTLMRVTVTGNKAGNIGGAIYISCNKDARSVSVEGGEISGNISGKSGSAIYLDKGIFTLVGGDSAVQLSGEIYKNDGTLYVSTATVDFTNVTFAVPSLQDETTLLSANEGLTFTEAYVSSIRLGPSVVASYNDAANTITVRPLTATVTLNVNGATVTQVVALGDFVLPNTVDGLDDTKYIAAWSLGGNSYTVGDAVEITGDCSFIAQLGNKYTVTLKYGVENTQTYYVSPGEKFYLPMDCELEQYTLVGWQVGDKRYIPAAGVPVTSDIVIIADMAKLYKVVLNDNGSQNVAWRQHAYSFVLGDCDAPEGKKLSYWNVNGVRYNIGDTVIVTSDTVVSAVFGDDDGDGLSAWVIAIIVILALLVVAGVVIALVLVFKRKKSTENAKTGAKKNKAVSTKKNTENKATKNTIKDTPKVATTNVTNNTAKNTTVNTARPTMNSTARSTAVNTTKSAPTNTTRSTPNSATRSAPVNTTKNTSNSTTRNTPNSATRSRPVTPTRSTPSSTTRSAPVNTTRSTSNGTTRSTPSSATRTTPRSTPSSAIRRPPNNTTKK